LFGGDGAQAPAAGGAATTGGTAGPQAPGAFRVGPQAPFIPTAPPVTSTDRFPAAVQQMAPSSGTQGGALRGLMNVTQNFTSGRGVSGGPLDADNWQSTRVTALNIRNVPGANIFMTATGMTG
jgi:hypothetical protein